MTMHYSATLFDCPGLSQKSRDEAVWQYCRALEQKLGTTAAVVDAYEASEAAFARHGEIPLPACATDDERTAVARWIDANAAGERAAFAGWTGDTGPAHFEI